jgi:predicted site-specific integrase-resolvase
MALTHFISLSEAAQKMRMSTAQIRDLIESGTIEGGILPDGEMVVTEESLPMKKEDLPEYKKHAHMKGIGIGIAEAARKYGLATSTVHGWAQSGYVTRIGQVGQKVLIDEADVAYCVEIFRRSGSRGRRLFNPDGTPYKPKSIAG